MLKREEKTKHVEKITVATTTTTTTMFSYRKKRRKLSIASAHFIHLICSNLFNIMITMFNSTLIDTSNGWNVEISKAKKKSIKLVLAAALRAINMYCTLFSLIRQTFTVNEIVL